MLFYLLQKTCRHKSTRILLQSGLCCCNSVATLKCTQKTSVLYYYSIICRLLGNAFFFYYWSAVWRLESAFQVKQSGPRRLDRNTAKTTRKLYKWTFYLTFLVAFSLSPIFAYLKCDGRSKFLIRVKKKLLKIILKSSLFFLLLIS